MEATQTASPRGSSPVSNTELGGECLGSDQRLANEVIQLTEGNGHRCQMQMTTKALERVVAITCVSTTSLPSNNGYIEMPLSHMA